MFTRYRRDANGRLVAHALVYTEKEHGIQRSMIDVDAFRIIERLKNAGHQAYIVGGAVRDLLQGKKPKDFDLVTDAIPSRIRKLFRNARVIGRRFRLVHILAGDKIFELSTFRSNKNGSVGNEFGTIDEDVTRRDFSFNALYFDPTDGTLLDFVGGYKDLKSGKVVPIIPVSRIFVEDPVRIIRGVKYSATGNFSIPLRLRLAIKKDAALLAGVSASRMTEEFFKILGSGRSADIFSALSDFRLLGYFVPAVWSRMQTDLNYSKRLFADLSALDELHLDLNDAEIQAPGEGDSIRGKQRLSVVLSHFLKSWVLGDDAPVVESHETFRLALQSARAALQPLNPPRVEMEAAILMIFRDHGIPPAQKPIKAKRRRRPVHKRASAPDIQPIPPPQIDPSSHT